MTISDILKEITKFIEGDYCISADDVLRWMQSDDIEVLGAIEDILMDQQLYDRIKPPLPLDLMFKFLLNYYRRCFIEDPHGEWAQSRYEAGHTLKSLFRGLWGERESYQTVIDEIKAMLADLYRCGDEAIKLAVTHASLEHLCEDPQIAEYFSDWDNDPVLKVAYKEALEWAEWFRRR